jgi:hypothetical protein
MQSLFLLLGIGLARSGKRRRSKRPWIKSKDLFTGNLGKNATAMATRSARSKVKTSKRRDAMTQFQLPEEMTAVVLDSYSGPEALRIEQRPVPKPGKDEVLVKVAASPINPSDLAFLDGQYGFKNPPPVVPGGEGSGIVVAVGPGPSRLFESGEREWHMG